MIPWKAVLLPPRQLQHNRRGSQAGAHHGHTALEVGSDSVHLVDEGHPGNPIAIRLSPDSLGLGLDSGHGIENGDGAVQNPQGTLHLGREVHMTRGIDDVDAVVIPEAGRSSRGDGDTPLLLLHHPVHGRSSVVNFTDLVVHSGVVQDALGSRRLTGINVSHDADIADLLEWNLDET